MKKIIFAALCVLCLVACEQSEQSVNYLHGKWEREMVTYGDGDGVIVYSYTFGQGTYVLETRYKMNYDNEWYSTYVAGKYSFEGESEGELRLYDRRIGEAVMHESIVYNFIVDGERLLLIGKNVDEFIKQ